MEMLDVIIKYFVSVSLSPADIVSILEKATVLFALYVALKAIEKI